jgi:exopolysaccharide production protein ExoZ
VQTEFHESKSCGGEPVVAPREGRLESIQLLRAVAAIGVVFTHAITRIGVTFPDVKGEFLFADSRGQLTVGDAGVDLFFVISGFIMLHVHGHDFGLPRAPLRFMARRVVRIVPIYWLLTTAALAFQIFAPWIFTTHYKGIDISWIIGSYLFLPIPVPGSIVSPLVGVGWTLNYEMFFYVVFATTLLFQRRCGLWLIFLGFACLVTIGISLGSTNPIVGFFTNWLLLDFLLGLAISAWSSAGRRLSGAAIGLVLITGVAALAATVVWSPPEQGPLRFIGWGIPCALIVLGMRSVAVPSGTLASAAIVLGDSSYSIYLWQFFALPGWAQVMRGAGAVAIPFDVNVLILTALVTLTGFGGWLLIERPITRLARSWLIG